MKSTITYYENYENDLVSIIMPAYNAAISIKESIASILVQTYEKWELIIVDDKSTDNTIDIITGYTISDRRIKLVKLACRQCVAAVRNAGLKVAKGRYIAFLDSDDLWKVNKLEKQLNYMTKNNLAFTYSSYDLIDDSGNSTGKYVKSKTIMQHEDILKNTIIGCLTVMIDRAVTGDFRMPIIAHTEDNMTWRNILMRGHLAYGLPEILASYRVSKGSLTSNKGKAALLQWKTYRDYCHLNIIKSAYYFCCYAFNAFTKTKNNNYANKIEGDPCNENCNA